MENIFDLILGLPLHPLIDHVVVIFLPVFSLALIALYIFEGLREKYSLIVQIGLGIAAVSAFIAKESGEALSLRVGTPIKHADLGEKLVPLAFVLFITSLIWFYLLRNPKKVNINVVKIVGLVSVLLATAALIMTYLVGHSGAEATWKERIAPKEVVQETTNNQSMPETGAAIVLNAAEVALHNSSSDCWSIVNNQVYNLTSYVNSHPGGVANIKNMCGKDASAAFSNQHANQGKPNNVLSGFVLGAVGQTISSIPTTVSPTVTNNQEYEKENEEEENEGDDD
jgi:cytochrome b involved in lipid metabolism